jgi:hypothetical protein
MTAMSNLATQFLLGTSACLLIGCSSPQFDKRPFTQSDPKATSLVAASQDAHGGKAFAKIRDVSVRYEGNWPPIVPIVQPTLSDIKFLGRSEERMLIDSRFIAQEHSGPDGKKVVIRESGTVTVAYNGVPSSDSEVNHAAALVADVYAMFLLGPFYFDRPGVVFAPDGEAVVDNATCDKVLAILRPGFGYSKEDRVILFIDRATKRLRRVRMTLDGLESTRGAEVDVTFRDFREIGGILWATDFDERIRVPFDLPAHHWNMLGLDLNRGLHKSDLTVDGFKGRAGKPAASFSSE